MLEDVKRFKGWLKFKGRSWSTCGTYACVLEQWSAFLDGGSPTVEGAKKFLGSKKGSGASVSTLYSYLLILRMYLKWRGEPIILDYPEITQARADSTKEYYRKNYLSTGGRCIKVLNKRPRPRICESCGLPGRLEYHHWDEEDLSKGLWLCWRCHMFAEGVESGLTSDSYLELKQRVEAETNEENRST